MADTASLIQQYLNAINNSQNPNNINMVQADPGNYLQNNFFQLPAYQLLYGQNANSLDPTMRFMQDPGYQYNQEETAKQLQRSYAGKGLLDSGSMLRALSSQIQGQQNQGYQQWLGQQNGLMSDYQNRMAQLATKGSQNTGSQNALANGNQLANISSNTGSNLANIGVQGANANLATGSNISSLFGNQGTFGANAMLSTAAAQANNLMQGAALQTQIDSANAASRAGSMNSLFSGLGSAFGKGGAFGA